MPVWALGLSCEAPEVLGFTLPHSSKPSESTRPEPFTGSVEDRKRPLVHAQQLGQRTSTSRFDIIVRWSWFGRQCGQRCEEWWPGSAVSGGFGAAHGCRGHFRHFVAAWLERAVSHDGTKIDLLAVAPKMVGFWVDQASLLCSASSAHWNRGLFFLKAIRPSFVSGWLEGWSGIGTCWSSCFRVASGRRRGSRERRRGSLLPALSRTSGTMFHRCFVCPALPTVRHARLTRGSPCGTFARTAIRGTVCTWHFPLPRHNPPTSSLERTCPALRDGILEGVHLHGRLFVGHWHVAACRLAVVAVGELGNLKAAACGAVPCDVPPGQTSRDGEDHAAATAGHTIWTCSRCTLIAKGPSRQSTFQRAKFWVQGAPALKFGAGFWFPMTRSGQSMSRCTPPCATWRQDGPAICSEGEMTVPTCL